MLTITRRADVHIPGLSALRSAETDGSRSSHGASLVEIMAVLAVVAICLGMALPSLLVTREDWIARTVEFPTSLDTLCNRRCPESGGHS